MTVSDGSFQAFKDEKLIEQAKRGKGDTRRAIRSY